MVTCRLMSLQYTMCVLPGCSSSPHCQRDAPWDRLAQRTDGSARLAIPRCAPARPQPRTRKDQAISLGSTRRSSCGWCSAGRADRARDAHVAKDRHRHARSRIDERRLCQRRLRVVALQQHSEAAQGRACPARADIPSVHADRPNTSRQHRGRPGHLRRSSASRLRLCPQAGLLRCRAAGPVPVSKRRAPRRASDRDQRRRWRVRKGGCGKPARERADSGLVPRGDEIPGGRAFRARKQVRCPGAARRSSKPSTAPSGWSGTARAARPLRGSRPLTPR